MNTDTIPQTVVVTGSSGLIGSAVVRRLAGSYRVVGFDRAGPPYPPPQAECVSVDLTSGESVRAGLDRVRHSAGERIASVVHLAAYYDFSGEPSPLYEEVTVRGTARLLRELAPFQVEQFVFSSTMLVHAPCEPGQRIDEDWPLDPTWDYPQSKVDTERTIRERRGAIPAVLLRIAGVYDDRCHSIPLAHQIQRIHERWLTSHLYPGDLTRGQAFVHLDDLVDSIVRTIGQCAPLALANPAMALLIGEPETLGYGELQQALGQLIHQAHWPTFQIPKPVAKTGAWLQGLSADARDALAHRVAGGERDGEAPDEPFIKPWMIDRADDHYALDIGRAHALLGWQPTHSLRETLPKMVATLKADSLAWYRDNKLAA